MNLFTNRNRLTAIENTLMVTKQKSRKDKLEAQNYQAHTRAYKTGDQQGPSVQHRGLYLISCNNL